MAKYIIPPINEPIMKPNGTMSLAWYLYLTQGGSGGGGGGGDDKNIFRPPMLSFMWSDHILNDVQWLRADTFSWQDGGVYEAAYGHLADDIDGKSLSSEIISGITVQFYLADDGHKICPASEESNVVAIYAATGVAWYYIIDTVNERFKLPQTKFAFVGLRTSVGDYVPEALPNITGTLTNVSSSRLGGITATGAFTATYVGQTSASGNDVKENVYDISFSAHDSSSVYEDDATVQERATQMYLYFYVGNFTQTALENTAGITTETLNEKADIDFNNTNMIDYVVEKQEPTVENDYTWYRKYKSGWVEQGGMVVNNSTDGSITINLLIEMADTNYYMRFNPVMATNTGAATNLGAARASGCFDSQTTTTITVEKQGTQTWGYWEVKGMAA